jgi:hypothetical protein
MESCGKRKGEEQRATGRMGGWEDGRRKSENTDERPIETETRY